MAKERQYSAYLWGKDNINYAHIEHYKRALTATDLQKEEYFTQHVFHGSSHAGALTKEIFQKKRRNNVTNMIDSDELLLTNNNNIINEVRSSEHLNFIKYSKIIEDHRTIDPRVNHSCEEKVGLTNTVLDISNKCSESELKVLAYHIVMERLDQVLCDLGSSLDDLGKLGLIIREIWEFKVSDIAALNKYVGTRYQTESSRRSLIHLIRTNFPSLLIAFS
jgi:hypothetical protein